MTLCFRKTALYPELLISEVSLSQPNRKEQPVVLWAHHTDKKNPLYPRRTFISSPFIEDFREKKKNIDESQKNSKKNGEENVDAPLFPHSQMHQKM